MTETGIVKKDATVPVVHVRENTERGQEKGTATTSHRPSVIVTGARETANENTAAVGAAAIETLTVLVKR